MRRIAVINQKGGVGKTTTCANLGAALARLGRRVVVVDMDPQANLSLHLGQELFSDDASSYTVLTGETAFEAAVRPTSTPGLSIVPAHIDLSGAELELASAIGRETLLRDAVDDWERAARSRTGAAPADYLILDCPPSLGLLSVNALAAAREVLIAVQTEFFALQGMSKLVEVVQLLRRRLNPELRIRGILPCLYDSRLRLAREVLAEVRRYFPGQVFQTSIRTNVKLAEAPSHGVTIFDYDAQCTGATDHVALARELQAQEGGDPPAPPETAPGRAGELERRLSDLARGSRAEPVPEVAPDDRPDEPAPDPAPGTEVEPALGQEPDPQPEPDPDPDPGPEPELEPQPERSAEPEIRPVSFPTVAAAESRRAGDDLIVLSEPSAEPTRPYEAGKEAVAIQIDGSGPQLPQEPHEDTSPPVKVTLEPISWQPRSPTPADATTAGAPVEDRTAEELESSSDGLQDTTSGEEDPPEAPSEASAEPPEALAELDVPRPAEPRPPSRWNFTDGYGEDRPHMASKMGPRTP